MPCDNPDESLFDGGLDFQAELEQVEQGLRELCSSVEVRVPCVSCVRGGVYICTSFSSVRGTNSFTWDIAGSDG
jgi:hypothetical protein